MVNNLFIFILLTTTRQNRPACYLLKTPFSCCLNGSILILYYTYCPEYSYPVFTPLKGGYEVVTSMLILGGTIKNNTKDLYGTKFTSIIKFMACRFIIISISSKNKS